METNKLMLWAKKINDSLKYGTVEQKAVYSPNRIDKIKNLTQMILDRGDYITRAAIKSQLYMNEIQDALSSLSSYGVSIPDEKKHPENPLKDI